MFQFINLPQKYKISQYNQRFALFYSKGKERIIHLVIVIVIQR